MPVNSTFVAIGPEARVFFENAPWAVIDGNFRHTGEEVVVTDTESSTAGGTIGVFNQRRLGLQDFDFTATMQYDVSVGIVFDTQLVPFNGTFGKLIFLPSKIQIGPPYQEGYKIPFFKVLESNGNFAVRGSAPVTMRIAGKNDGPFSQYHFGQVINGGPVGAFA